MRNLSRFGRALALSLLLGGCATAPGPSCTAPAALGGIDGVCVVSDVFGQSAAGAASPVGQRVRLGMAEAQDLKGRLCANPTYLRGETTEAALLGHAGGLPGFGQLDRMVTVLEVECAQEAFGRYAYWKEGSLLAFDGARAFRLVKWDGSGPLPTAPTRAEMPAPAAMVAAPASAAPAGGMEHPATPGARIYLASYRDEESARRGWTSLRQRAPLLGQLSPAMTRVTLPRRGKFIRLHAEGASLTQARQLCRQLAALLPDCGAKRTD